MSTVNDLYSRIIRKDSIGTHDWSDDTKWQNYPVGGWPGDKDSSFTIQPVAGQAIIIPRARVRYSKDVVMHSPLLIEYYVGSTKVRTTIYADQRDFFDRFDEFLNFDIEGGAELEHDIWSHEYEFDAPIALWSSIGASKLNKLVVKIEDDEPYKNSVGGPIGMARVRYLGCLICTDPDYEP